MVVLFAILFEKDEYDESNCKVYIIVNSELCISCPWH